MPTFRRAAATLLSTALFSSQTLFAYQGETGFWSQRAESARRLRTPTLLAQAPLAALSQDPLWRAPAAPPDNRRDAFLPALAADGIPRRASGAPGDSLTVIHIQDVHGHAGAQKRIAALIESVWAKFPDAALALEGAAGPFTAGPARSRSGDNAAAATFLFNLGLISGAERALLGAVREHRAIGLENPALYAANVAAVRQAAPLRPVWSARLARAEARLAAARAETFSAALLALDRTVESYRRETMSLTAFADDLYRRRPDARRFPETARFLEAWELEKNLNMEAVRRERAASFESLAARLAGPRLEALLQASLAFRAGAMSAGDFHGLTGKLFAEAGLSLKDAPQFARYLRYVAAADGVTPRALWKELERLEAESYARLCQTAAEKSLVADTRRLALLQKLTALSMTAEEWTAYAGQRDGVGDFLARWTDSADTRALAPFETFYESAHARDRALAENFWETLSGREGAAVLVAGGFHTDGIERFLKEKGASVVTVAPKFDDPHAAPDAFTLFTRDRTPVESLFEAPKISVPETLALHPIGRDPHDLSRAEAVRRLGPAVADLRRQLADSEESQVLAEVGRGRDGATLVALSRAASPDVPADVVAVAGAAVEEGISGAVLQRYPSGFQRRWTRLAAAARQGVGRFFHVSRWSRRAKTIAVAALVAPIFLLLPDTAMAYEFARQGAEVFFTPDKGEHLWGAALELLRLAGVENPAGPRVWEVVQRIVEANPSIENPSLIYQGVPYSVPVDLLPAVTPAAPVVVPPAAVPPAVTAPALPTPGAEISTPAGLIPGLVQGLQQSLWLGGVVMGAAFFARARNNRALRPAPAQTPRFAGLRHLGRSHVLRHISFSRAAVDTLRAPWLIYGVAIWGLLSLFPGFVPFGWASAQLDVAGFDSFLKILSGFAVFIVFRFAFALRQQVKTPPPAAPDAAFHAWRTLLAQPGAWTPRQTNQAIDYARTLLRNHRFQVSGADAAARAVAYHALSRAAQETAERLETLVVDLPDMEPRSRQELAAKALWFESLAHYAVRARKLVVGSVINVEHIRVKYGGTLHYRQVLWAYVRAPGQSFWRLLTDEKEGSRVVSAMKELVGRHVARPLFGMNRRLAQEHRKFNARASEVLELGNRLEPGLYGEIPAKVLEMRRRLFETDLDDKERPGLPGVWDGRNLVSPFLALVFTGIYATYVLQTGTVGLPVVVVAALVGGLGVMALIHRFFIDKGFWDPAYHTESQALDALRPRLRRSLGKEAENLPAFERLMFDNEREKSEEAFMEEMSLSPAADAIILVARSEAEEAYFRRVASGDDRRIFPQGVPVLVLRQDGAGTGRAQAQAFAALNERWPEWQAEYPRLEGRALSEARTLVFFGENGGAADWQKTFPDWTLPTDGSALSVLDLQVMNGYKAARALRKAGEGGLVFFTLDRPYVGPVNVTPGAVNLVSSWKPADEVKEEDLGLFVTVENGQVMEIVGEAGYTHQRKYFNEKDGLGRHAGGAGPVQAFAGAAVVSFADPLVFRLYGEIAGDILDTAPGAPVDLLDDVLIPLRLLCADPSGKRLYSYLGARGVWSEGQEGGEHYRRLFNRYERSFQRHSPPPGLLVALTPPQGSSEFILADRQDLTDLEPAALPAPTPVVNPFQWLEAQVAQRPWLRGLYRFSPRAVLAFSMFTLAARAAVGAPLAREAELALQAFGKWTFIVDWKTGWLGGMLFTALPGLETLHRLARDAAVQALDGAAAAVKNLTLLAAGFLVFIPASAAADGRIFTLTDGSWVVLAGAAALATAPVMRRAHGVWKTVRDARPPRPSRGTRDVTAEVLIDPAQSASRLKLLIRRLDGSPDTRHAALRRGLGLAIARLVPDALVRGDYLQDFDRREMQKAMDAIRPAKTTPREELGQRIDDLLRAAFYHQLAVAQGAASEGRAPLEELKQAAYLMGAMDRWDMALDREAVLERLEKSLGILNESERAAIGGALSRGINDRRALFALPEAVPAQAELRVYRVNELFGTAPEGQPKRRVLQQQFLRSVRFFHPGGASPVLLVHGRELKGQGESAEAVKRAVRGLFAGASEALQAKVNIFLAKARVVYLEKDAFAPQDVLARLADGPMQLWDMELLTADAAPILIDPYAEDPGFRVTLLDLVDGEITLVDVAAALRRAAEAARVISTGA